MQLRGLGVGWGSSNGNQTTLGPSSRGLHVVHGPKGLSFVIGPVLLQDTVFKNKDIHRFAIVQPFTLSEELNTWALHVFFDTLGRGRPWTGAEWLIALAFIVPKGVEYDSQQVVNEVLRGSPCRWEHSAATVELNQAAYNDLQNFSSRAAGMAAVLHQHLSMKADESLDIGSLDALIRQYGEAKVYADTRLAAEMQRGVAQPGYLGVNTVIASLQQQTLQKMSQWGKEGKSHLEKVRSQTEKKKKEKKKEKERMTLSVPERDFEPFPRANVAADKMDLVRTSSEEFKPPTAVARLTPSDAKPMREPLAAEARPSPPGESLGRNGGVLLFAIILAVIGVLLMLVMPSIFPGVLLVVGGALVAMNGLKDTSQSA